MAKANSTTIAAPPLAWEATASLMQVLNPENPQDHFEDDIKATAMSLLKAGWAEYGVCRQKNGLLLGGHGRVQAAHWLSEQAPEWFEHEWQKWQKGEGRSTIAKEHESRFQPAFWQQCPVNVVNLDPPTQKAVMIRLNNQTTDGQKNNKRMAALLMGMTKETIEQAGFTQSVANSFISAFAERKADLAAAAPEADLEGKQYFERPDATDYAGSGDGTPNDAIGESGDLHSNFDANDDFGDELDGDESGASVPQYTMADVDDNIEGFRADVFDHTKEYSETRAVLYTSYVELEEWKTLVDHAAAVLNVQVEGVVAKLWRSAATLEALRKVKELYPLDPAVKVMATAID